MTAPATGRVRRRLTVRGTVQGVGFRPYVHRLAADLALAGFVGNTADGVLIEVEGPADDVDRFCELLARQPPPLATLTAIGTEDLPPTGTPEPFTIRPSTSSAGRTQLPPDTATCADCLRELADPGNRRHRHPFITCTHCGPRFTIATALPYDRAATTMAGFPSARPAPASTPTPPTAASTPSPSPAPTAGPGCAWSPPPAATSAPPGTRTPSRRPVPCWPPDGSSPSRAWAATTWPATPPTTAPSPGCAPARNAVARPSP